MKRLFLLLGLALPAFGCGGTVDSLNPNSQCQYNVYQHSANGWLLTTPNVHFVFWGNYWSQTNNYSDSSYYQSTWNNLYADNNIFLRLSEYGVSQGVLDPKSYFTDPNLTVPVPGSFINDAGLDEINDNGITAEIANEIAAGYLPLPDHQSLYVIFLPLGSNTISDLTNNYGGYHGSANYNGVQYTFAIISYSNRYNTNMVVSHEIAEAMTDPDLSTGYFGNGGETEIADLCNWVPENFDGVDLMKLWSAKLCQCL